MKYKYTQINPIVVYLLPFSPVIFWIIMYLNGYGVFDKPIILGIFLFLVFILSFFSKLTISVDEEKVSINFLCPKLKKDFYIKDMKKVEIVKNEWYYGWGIRILPDGLLFNVYGLDAIEITFKDKKIYKFKKIRIGTNMPGLLKKIIEDML